MTLRESGPTSLWSFLTRESGETVKEATQMTDGENRTGAASHAEDPSARDRRKAELLVRRLQARIVKAQQAGRPGQVKVLQRMLVHSHSARLVAVARVSQNAGSKTPGVDGET